jgi:hypothetical protein
VLHEFGLRPEESGHERPEFFAAGPGVGTEFFLVSDAFAEGEFDVDIAERVDGRVQIASEDP